MSADSPKSPFKGVSFHRRAKKWVPSVLLNPIQEGGKRKLKQVGYFNTDLEAAVARNAYIEANGLTCKKTLIEGVIPTGVVTNPPPVKAKEASVEFKAQQEQVESTIAELTGVSTAEV